MAERLKTKIVEQEKMVDVVCGPDAYKDLPRLLASTENKQAAGNIWALSRENLSTGVCEQHRHRPACAEPSLISAFVFRLLGSIISKPASSKFSIF